MNDDMLNKIRTGSGFIAALDQSGGSTPKALGLYGVGEDAWSSEDEMFDLMHAMRTRIVTSPAFTGERVLAAILFEQTMDRQFEGVGAAEYLWSRKQVVPFVKVDKGLAEATDGAQVMKPMPQLRELCDRAVGLGVFGTKMRSVIQLANEAGVNAVVDQQFEVAAEIITTGLVPIVEPEVDIHSPEKEAAESLMRDRIATHLDGLADDQHVILKLSVPTVDDFYAKLITHPRVLRVAALSGGYSREEANDRLSRNHNMIASFSRALTEGLNADQTDSEFNATLDTAIANIYAASTT
ncbi:MAG: fructose bisphosphate aldolase [Microlunatus sp.]|nr:fructose bisphosphate aldolase [Microlunatus sp.]MDN5771257.1 fructose bisphosphate aldolase [Microlunatus sp.]MDN5803064.1 fructose bisphosphate aldolase [Microlunatus sp.]